MAFPKGKTKRNVEISSEDYAKIRKMQAESLKGNTFGFGKKPWNAGKKNIFSEETIRKMSEKRKGKHVSEETRKRMCEAQRKRYQEHPETFPGRAKGKISINNGTKCHYINKDEKIPAGYVLGQGKHKQYVIKDKKAYSKIVSERISGNKNPMYGKGYKLSGGNNGHAIYIYTFENIDYNCRDDLMKVLKPRFPEITESTIRRLQKGICGEKTHKKFQYVIDNLTWRFKKDENKIS